MINLNFQFLGELISNKTVYLFTAIRLVILPALAYFVCRGLGLYTLLPMALIVTCMPCGLNPVVFPKLIGQDCRLGAKLILLSSILSCATIPLWLWIIG